MNFKRVVIKVGTNLLTLADGKLNTEFMARLAREIKRVLTSDVEVVLVTSGAVAAGRGELAFDSVEETLSQKQALAAVGQSVLMQRYYEAFTHEHGIPIAQILLTAHDFDNLDTLQNTHNALRLLLKKKVLPIVNENDVTATDELKYMANDRLAARVSNIVGADGLVILTDVDGLFTADPKKNPTATLVKETTREELGSCDATGASPGGHGGMYTKCEAAKLAECTVFVANGTQKNILTDIVLKYENPGTKID